MGGELPEMADWDELFDESYFRFYGPMLDDERARIEAEGAIGLADVEPGAEVLDCPCGFARHSAVLAKLGYRMTGVDRSAVQLAEARRRLGSAEWPRLSRADYRELPFEDASFDAALNLFTSLGYLDRDGDVTVLRELRRVLRPGGRLVLETMHRDRLARVYTPRAWDPLPDGSTFVQERQLRPGRGDGREHLPDPRRRRSGRAALRPPRLHGGRVGRDARGSRVLAAPLPRRLERRAAHAGDAADRGCYRLRATPTRSSRAASTRCRARRG